MSFNIEKLTKFCVKEIEEFAKEHKEETFYAFAFDAQLLCMNSLEQASKTLKEYQSNEINEYRNIDKWEDLTEEDLEEEDFLLSIQSNLDRNDKEACLSVINDSRRGFRERGYSYIKEENIQSLKENTGDWCYQGFTEMTETVGFDDDAYQEHYDLGEKEQLSSKYGLAMNKLIENLKLSNAFKNFKLTNDFLITRVEHE